MFKFALVILDGYGLRAEREGNAARLARTPTLDRLLSDYPMIELQTSGAAVGLPDGVMGNSEVGHMNIGAGRIVRQNLVLINNAITDGTFKQNSVLLEQLAQIRERGGAFHILGLCSDSGVHSHIDHLKVILEVARSAGVERIFYHALMDGRDTSPNAGAGYLEQIEGWLERSGRGRIATVVGRYFAMDRDNRWDRIEQAWRMLVTGQGERYGTAAEAIQASYANDVTDEFVTPKVIDPDGTIAAGDAVLMMNFRADRMRQLVQVFTDPGFNEFPRDPLEVDLRSMTVYDASFTIPVLFSPMVITNVFPEVLARAGYRQLRLAETEKYAHVTYFFNGGAEQRYPGEDRKLIPSPKVATYDLQPEMSAPEVTAAALEAITGGRYDCLIMNFANPDMVGHTGDLDAAITGLEVVDNGLGKILTAVQDQGAALFLTSDHGNLELMIDPETGEIHTAHTTLNVPLVLAAPDKNIELSGTGKLADIAPTILTYLDLEIPPAMTGTSRLVGRAVHVA
ncbi:MAG: 2,3-bisphosphoglycerate-independent phosphoglycerate mutase [Candidatus Neomarinimicrobiota bacterium]